ncbi:MAG: type I methionyl aminopeptidase [Candidatus Paraimprobicoccus trichonymphae]|uniref:Methionine aminopeptidase n=1 Tax=Candidatus Paraimprobicoccus trichonymphae TaxID=3033793 RepID=A0AA48KZD3_9FIRM|nr:MAG: type I methionyl aminopeptidase [Candidatus Paraimprobicoccus trichonymphae]
MIILKTEREISIMIEAGRISARALKLAGESVKPGISTWEIDSIAQEYIESQDAVPSFLNHKEYPASTCISINNVVVHGVPSKDIIVKKGDIVSIDIGAYFEGFHGDNAYTFACGEISETAQRLINTTKESLAKGIEVAVVDNKIGDISHTIQKYAEERGYSLVRKYVGHGIGTGLHEDPSVPNFGEPHKGAKLCKGMVIAIEPMVNIGTHEVRVLSDNWTTVTADGKLSAHFEHTIAITDDGPIILTNAE